MARQKQDMRYISTRGQAPALDFEQVVLTGLAPDGGLYVPASIPRFSRAELAAMANLPYTEIAFRVMKPFVGQCIPELALRRIIEDCYSSFHHDAVVPLNQLAHDHYLLELFHGPTLAFKDIALQLLGRLLDYFLSRNGQTGAIMGATSGDTGSAAIEGCRDCQQLDIFILHPHDRVSTIQRRQMTTVTAPNVHNIAIEGDFDDAQALVKASFADQGFLPEGKRLIAVNSINWARIMAQIVYYVAAGVALGAPERAVAFTVPSANFGNLFAGYMAYRMGLPVKQFVIATNANDILHRTLSRNDLSHRTLQATWAPSMDIVVSSNFERLLFEAHDRDGQAVQDLMTRFSRGQASLDEAPLAALRRLFASASVDDDTILESIRQAHQHTGQILDPHTAVGYWAANAQPRPAGVPMITLATAHPAKFEAAIRQAGLKLSNWPASIANLMTAREHYKVLPAELSAVQGYMAAQSADC